MKKSIYILVGIIIVIITLLKMDNLCEGLIFSSDEENKALCNQTSTVSLSIEDNKEYSDNLYLDKEGKGSVDFDLKFKNTGNEDVSLRVMFEIVVIDEENNVVPISIDNSSIKFYYQETKNLEKEDINLEQKDGELNQECENLDQEFWDLGDDGYYYYKKVLKPQEFTSNNLIKRIDINLSEEEVYELYDKKIKIIVYAECKQVENNLERNKY